MREVLCTPDVFDCILISIVIVFGTSLRLNTLQGDTHHTFLQRLAQKGDLSDTELQEVARNVQRDGKLKKLADELEMVPQLQSLQHDENPSLILRRRWRSEIQNAVEVHSLLVHHLKCIGLTETSDRYRLHYMIYSLTC